MTSIFKLQNPESGSPGQLLLAKPEHNGLIPFMHETRVVVTSSASQVLCGVPLPKYAWVTAHSIKVATLPTATTGTYIGLGTGTSGDPDMLDEVQISAMTADTEFVSVPDTSPGLLAAATQFYLTPTNGSGTASGTIDTCDVIVRIWGWIAPQSVSTA